MILNQKNRSAGYSLLEVLVALVVLSLGLLGVAALQATGLKFGHEFYLRTQAVLQAYDIIDRMRANSDAVANTTKYDTVALGNIPTVATNCGTTACTKADMADYDIAEWNTNNSKVLPSGRGALAKNGDIRTVTLEWLEKDIVTTLIITVRL